MGVLIRGERIVCWWPNKNTNTIWAQKFGRTQIVGIHIWIRIMRSPLVLIGAKWFGRRYFWRIKKNVKIVRRRYHLSCLRSVGDIAVKQNEILLEIVWIDQRWKEIACLFCLCLCLCVYFVWSKVEEGCLAAPVSFFVCLFFSVSLFVCCLSVSLIKGGRRLSLSTWTLLSPNPQDVPFHHGEKVGFCRSKQVVGSPKWIDPPLDPTSSCKKGSERPCRIVRTRKKNCSFTWKTIGEVQIPKITRLTISWMIYTNARGGLFSHSILESSEKQIPFSES